MNAATETERAPLALPDVTERLAQISAEAQRDMHALFADRPVMREVAELEAAIVAANRELAALDRTDVGDDASAAANVLGRGVILRRRIAALVAQRLALAPALAAENDELRGRLSAVTARAQRLVDADRAAAQALAEELDAWRAPRVPIAESRPWERPPLSPAQERSELERRLGVAPVSVTPA